MDGNAQIDGHSWPRGLLKHAEYINPASSRSFVGSLNKIQKGTLHCSLTAVAEVCPKSKFERLNAQNGQWSTRSPFRAAPGP